MTALNVTFNQTTSDGRFPLYRKYEGQFEPQPAYISLDLRNGECTANYNGNIGGTPSVQFHNLVLTFPIPADTHRDTIMALIYKHANNLQIILNGSEVVWDGSNHVGQLNDDAERIYERMNDFGNGFSFLDSLIEGGMVDEESFAEWLGDDMYPSCNVSVKRFAAALHERDGENGLYFSDEMNSPDAILGALRTLWADQLYSGDDVTRAVARYLLKCGECDESAWLDELNEFAND